MLVKIIVPGITVHTYNPVTSASRGQRQKAQHKLKASYTVSLGSARIIQEVYYRNAQIVQIA